MKRRGERLGLASVAAACIFVGAAERAVGQKPTAPSVLTGAYTEKQALHGREIYYATCLSCHGEAMAGLDQAPPLAGPQFAATWDGQPLQALAARIRLTMPPDRPNSLSQADAVDVLTYILWYNGLPIGETPLDSSPSALAAIKFETPAGAADKRPETQGATR